MSGGILKGIVPSGGQGGGGGGPGDVTGPGFSTDNAVCRFDGATGKVIQNSGATLDDTGHLFVDQITTGDLNMRAPDDSAWWTFKERPDHLEGLERHTGIRYRVVMVPIRDRSRSFLGRLRARFARWVIEGL